MLYSQNRIKSRIKKRYKGEKIRVNKIRILVAHNDEKIRNDIIEAISDLEYVEIVGVAREGTEAYQKIIDLKPEIVFSKYNYNDISGIELMKQTKEKLKENFPIFNTIGEIPDEEITQVINITGDKINAFVRKPYGKEAQNIVKAYKAYKERRVTKKYFE